MVVELEIATSVIVVVSTKQRVVVFQVALDQLEGILTLLEQRRLLFSSGLVFFLWVVNLVLELLEEIQSGLFLYEDGPKVGQKTVEVVAQLSFGLFPQRGVMLFLAVLLQCAQI